MFREVITNKLLQVAAATEVVQVTEVPVVEAMAVEAENYN